MFSNICDVNQLKSGVINTKLSFIVQVKVYIYEYKVFKGYGSLSD